MSRSNFLMRIVGLLSVLLCFALAGADLRAENPTVVESDTRSSDLRELLELTHPDSALAAVADAVFDQLASSFPELSREELLKIRRQFDVAAIKERLYAIYDSSYSSEEVTELLDFYRSPIGEKVRSVGESEWFADWTESYVVSRRMIEKVIAGKIHPEVQWTAFVPEDSSFTVLLPGDPTEMIIPTRIPSGVIDAHQYMTTSTYCAYIVSIADSVTSSEGTETEPVLESVAATLVDRIGGELVSEIPFLYSNGLGRELTIMLTDGDGVYRVRLLISGSRLYQLTAVTPISEYYTSQAVHFFDSFAVTSR